jgi:S-(hydroxymethyl)glutathione dehydrogenase / alcohol dehydrogenase
MKALVFHKSKHVAVEERPDPRIEDPRDVVLKVTATAICGSDLHIYNGLFPQSKPLVLGHEFMGIVEELGSDVKKLKRGDRVVVPFPIACGACWFCAKGFPTQCESSNPDHYGPEGATTHGKGGGLFGYTDLYGGYSGGQAQYVRVPFADVGPRKVPEGVTDEAALFLSDIVPTAYSGLKWADVQPGESVVVWGCGPVGLQAQKLARIMGAGMVIGVDIQPYRLAMARRFADSIVIDASKEDPVKIVRGLTSGRGADVAIEAIGMEVERSLTEKVSNALHLQTGSITAVERCFSAVRRSGRVSILGVYGTSYANFPLGQWVDKGLRVQAGQAWVHDYIDELMELVVQKKLRAEEIITHKLALAQAPHGYQIFNDKTEDCVKVVLDPWK